MREVGSHNEVGHLYPNILARYLATAKGLPLGRDSFGDIKF